MKSSETGDPEAGTTTNSEMMVGIETVIAQPATVYAATNKKKSKLDLMRSQIQVITLCLK